MFRIYELAGAKTDGLQKNFTGRDPSRLCSKGKYQDSGFFVARDARVSYADQLEVLRVPYKRAKSGFIMSKDLAFIWICHNANAESPHSVLLRSKFTNTAAFASLACGQFRVHLVNATTLFIF